MAVLTKSYLPMDWEAVDGSSDLDRVDMVLTNVPDEAFVRKLEARTMGRPDETDVRAKWNIVLIQRVLGHHTMQGLLRELKRNPTLRRRVGLSPVKGPDGVPDKDQMSRFWAKLSGEHAQEVAGILDAAQEVIRAYLPGFGERLGTDTTALETWARGRRDPEKCADKDADWGCKTRRWTDDKGQKREEKIRWFGYKAHLLVDTVHELPVARRLTKASCADNQHVLEMIREWKKAHPAMKPETVAMDKAYDDGPLAEALWTADRVKAVCDLRNTARDGEDGERLEGTDNILLGDDGRVYCFAKHGAQMVRQAMIPWGREEKRGTLKYRCPAAVAGQTCPDALRCSKSPYGRVVRVRMDRDWRRFGAIARGTKQWKRLYNGRSACERVNSRLKQGMGLEDLYVRGLKNVTLSLDLSMLALYGLALGHLRRGAQHWRSFTRVAT